MLAQSLGRLGQHTHPFGRFVHDLRRGAKERLFNELTHDRFLLEYDSPRAGGFAPLRFVPEGKTVVLGLVSTKVPQLETIDELKRRIDEAARYVPLEQLALSPQCGFASEFVGNLISEDDQKRKLEVVVETARQVWSCGSAASLVMSICRFGTARERPSTTASTMTGDRNASRISRAT